MHRGVKVKTGRVWNITAIAVSLVFAASVMMACVVYNDEPGNNEGDQTQLPTESATVNPSEQESIARVVIDAGHGGFDVGATGLGLGTKEDGLNLAVAKLLKEELEALNIEIIMTRETDDALGATKDEDMSYRREVISKAGNDLMVSIHMNMFSDRSVSGPMVFYMEGSEAGKELAACVINSLCDTVGRERRLPNPGDYYVLRAGTAPGIIVECGFLSNAQEEALLVTPEYQKLLAEGIALGIEAFLSGIAATTGTQDVN